MEIENIKDSKKAGFMKMLLMAIPLVTVFVISQPLPSFSYGLLSHEAIIDATWEKSIQPLLKSKYPNSTKEQLKSAHAYVYGGSVIADIGYYPFGSALFSHLVHYVRSGDFVYALLVEAHDINEYAFALGALCHFEADQYGHPLGTNKTVANMFPRLKNRYGKVVTFEQGRDQHVKVEFGFDVLQTARGNYESNAYHDFIGFQISDSVLDRALIKTYGIGLKDLFTSLPIAIANFRFSVKIFIPELTRDAWKIKNSFIMKLNPLATEKTYRYIFDKKNYRKEFATLKVQSTLLEIILGGLPKYGPLSRFKPTVPDSVSEILFEQSFETILANYSGTLKKLKSGELAYDNVDLDTGEKTSMGEYELADKTYYDLLMKLRRDKSANINDALKKNLIAYYSNRDSSSKYRSNTHKGKKITKALRQLNVAYVAQQELN